MSPVSTSTMSHQDPSVSSLISDLYQAPDAASCTVAARKLASFARSNHLRILSDGPESIISQLLDGLKSKSGYEREGALVGLEEIYRAFTPVNEQETSSGAEPYLLPTLSIIVDRYQETGKAQVVKEAAEKAAFELVKMGLQTERLPEAITPFLLSPLLDILEGGNVKWRVKLGALELLEKLPKLTVPPPPAAGAATTTSSSTTEATKTPTPTILSTQISSQLSRIIPILSTYMRDTKPEIASRSSATALSLITLSLRNPDVTPFTPTLIQCMAKPDLVPDTIKRLSSNVWVRDVDESTLSVLGPMLQRALKERSATVQRQTVVLIGNLFKLVKSTELANNYLDGLLPGVCNIADTASFPEVRAFADEAKRALLVSAGVVDEEAAVKDALKRSTASPAASTPGTPKKQVVEQEEDVLLAEQILKGLFVKLGGGGEIDDFVSRSLHFAAVCSASLADKREFDETLWDSHVVPFLIPFVSGSDKTLAKSISTANRKRWLDVDRERNASQDEDETDEGEGEKIVDLDFSLAYGGLLLLNHTTLKIRKGRRYGIAGANGAGKSTLLRAINEHRIENFPKDLKCFYVEHDIDGDDSETTCIDFFVSDKSIKEKNLSRQKISERLEEFGFDEERQGMNVSSLSGGWKMRLALARALICEADMLLLDEPTNHLSVEACSWLADILNSQKDLPIMIISHDSNFLDTVCTDIIHYHSKRLTYYHGNLSHFVEKYPPAKTYYTLSASLVKFAFPPPGSLMGVRSQTRAILKATDVTFTYPGSPKPSLMNASVAVTLSSRVGVIGPNGAGKSTLIKLLTGETVPDTGKVEKHPNLRVAYVAQHAFHNIGAHLEKTAIQYIAWRYQDGHDRETALKVTRKWTPEEKKQMETPIEGRNGEQRRVESIIGRQKLKKSFQYEIKWRGLDHKFNTWLPREKLIEKGFSKMVQQHDDLEASREGSGTRELSHKTIREHLVAIGLDGDIAEYNEMSGLSGGQKVKVVIAAALWSKPQLMIFDEPTNFLDREALGGLAVAIRDWAGAFVCISHNQEFVTALCPEIWEVEAGRIKHKGKAAVVDGDAFEDKKSSKLNTPSGSKAGTPKGTPAASKSGTPAVSGDEGTGSKLPVVKKKKLTRKQMKDREERRRQRTLRWLATSIPGTKREPDTDTEDEH